MRLSLPVTLLEADDRSWQHMLAPGSRRLPLSMLFLVIFYVTVLIFSSNEIGPGIVFANMAGPIFLIAILGVALVTTLRRCPVAIWTPYLLFLAQSALFFGLGPLAYHFGNSATVGRLSLGPLALSEHDLLRTNLLNSIGIFFALLGGHWVSRVRFLCHPHRLCPGGDLPKVRVETLAVVFLVSGALLKYGLILPYQFGMTNFVLPGVIESLGNLFDLGLAIVAYLAVKKRGVWRAVLWVLLPIHLTLILLEFGKTPLVLALILPALGAYWAHHSLRRLAVWGGSIAVLFYLMQPLVFYGRQAIAMDTGMINHASLQERLAITRSEEHTSELQSH